MNIFLLILQILLIALTSLLLLGRLTRFLKEHYQQPDASNAIYYALTQDNWRIALHRYPPAKDSQRSPMPVVLCHGLASNRFQVTLPGKSLAKQLSDKGHDVWVIELRGAGFSSDPKRNKTITFDEYVEQDIPAAVATILAETNAPKLHWVGYSTGALAALASSTQHASFASLIAIGAPMHFIDQPDLDRFVAVGWAFSFFGQVRLSLFTTLFSPLGGRMNPRLMRSLMNRENMAAPDIRSGLANAVENFSKDSLRQYKDWVLNNQLRSIDHRVDYREVFGKVSAPLLLIAGSRDILAPPSAVTPLLEKVSSSQKELKVAGKKEGFLKEYGHIDLAYGESAPKEVFVWIEEWLQKHNTTATEAADQPSQS